MSQPCDQPCDYYSDTHHLNNATEKNNHVELNGKKIYEIPKVYDLGLQFHSQLCKQGSGISFRALETETAAGQQTRRRHYQDFEGHHLRNALVEVEGLSGEGGVESEKGIWW